MSLVEQLEIIKKESARRILSIATIVLVTSLLMLAAGLLWKEKYESTATILIEDEKIIGRLLEDTTVPTAGANRPPIERDRAEMAEQILFARSVLNKVLEESGWFDGSLTQIERAQLVDTMRNRISVTNEGRNLIEISFRDPLPERAFRTVLSLSDQFIDRARESQSRESQSAYRFIAAETERYRQKLEDAEQRLQEFYAENGDMRPASGERVDSRINELLQTIQDTTLDLESARVRVRSLEDQLNGEATGATLETQKDSIRSRISELQSQLSELRLQYHDTYPDIASTQHKIDALREQLQRLDEAEASGTPPPDGAMGMMNPMQQELRAALSEARIQVATLEERLARNRSLLEEERNRGAQVSELEARAAELNREYEVTREFYDDLLQRRENARIAVNMAEDSEDLTISVQEPPTVPLQPSGLQLVHFALAGPLLGLGLAMGMVFLRVRFDERIRSSAVVARELHIPVLATVPMLVDGQARQRRRRVRGTIVAATLMLIACYGLVAALRFNGTL